MMSKTLLAGLLLFSSALVIVVECACPDEDEIEPCSCEVESGKSVLRCKNVPGVSVLEKVAENSDGYRYDEVHIEDSTLQYIPKVVPEKIRMDYLAFRNMTVTRLVDDIPNTLDELKSVVLQKIVSLNGFSWEVFKNTKGLESLVVDQVPIPVLKEEFNTYVTHNLKTLLLQYTGMKEIQKGALEGFGSLQMLSLIGNSLQDLKRESFPSIFNAELLQLQSNKFNAIPADFFTAMPNLRTVFLTSNLISRFYEPAYTSVLPAVVEISDNPIKCDCYLRWIADRNIKNVQGHCAAPKQLKGKSLPDLTEQDFDC